MSPPSTLESVPCRSLSRCPLATRHGSVAVKRLAVYQLQASDSPTLVAGDEELEVSDRGFCSRLVNGVAVQEFRALRPVRRHGILAGRRVKGI